MSARLLRFAPLGLGLAALAGIVVWLGRSVDFLAVAEALRQANPGPLLLMTGMIAIFGAARALRLHVVLQGAGGFLHTYHVNNIGLMVNSLLPLRSGELCMALLLGAHLPGGRAEALSRIFVDRLLDALAVFALFAATAPLLGDRTQTLNTGRALLLCGTGVAAAIAAVWLACDSENMIVRGVSALARAAGRDEEPWKSRSHNVLHGLRALFHGRLILIAGTLSLALWGMHVLVMLTGMSALFPPPGFSCAMLAVALTILGLALAPTPAGIGTTYGAIVLALGFFGVEPSQALAFAILYHAANTMLSLALGMTGLWALGLRLPLLLEGIGVFNQKSSAQ
jgi:uncharacterized protein (TIRG00374 family)